MKNCVVLVPLFLSVTSVWGQNSVVVTQSGGHGNSAVIVQSGPGGQVEITQSSPVEKDSARSLNQISLQVPKGTLTSISQFSAGTNQVELNQDAQATTTIYQSSPSQLNSIQVLPQMLPLDKSNSKRRRP